MHFFWLLRALFQGFKIFYFNLSSMIGPIMSHMQKLAPFRFHFWLFSSQAYWLTDTHTHLPHISHIVAGSTQQVLVVRTDGRLHIKSRVFVATPACHYKQKKEQITLALEIKKIIYTYKTWISYVCACFPKPPKVPASWNIGSRHHLGQLRTWRSLSFIIIFWGPHMATIFAKPCNYHFL